jgi:hypothetical protein
MLKKILPPKNKKSNLLVKEIERNRPRNYYSNKQTKTLRLIHNFQGKFVEEYLLFFIEEHFEFFLRKSASNEGAYNNEVKSKVPSRPYPSDGVILYRSATLFGNDN